jgi:hypothetical protein
MHSFRLFAAAGSAFVVLTMVAPMGAAMAERKAPKSEQQQYRVVKKPDGKVLFCTKIETTGSLVPQNVCNTAKDWRALGVSINTGHAA